MMSEKVWDRYNKAVDKAVKEVKDEVYMELEAPQIAPNTQQTPSGRVSEVVKDITERMLRLELARAIQDLGPQKAAQVVVQVFRQKGLPKELRRHV
jgi:hypothetical protein